MRELLPLDKIAVADRTAQQVLRKIVRLDSRHPPEHCNHFEKRLPVLAQLRQLRVKPPQVVLPSR
ncbi:hypothetical protein D3C87_1823650 [compost metagenome]